MNLFEVISFLGQILDGLGVLVIVFGVVIATVSFTVNWIKEEALPKSYKNYRQNLARVILLGLEILVAGDIIRSVAGTPSFTSVGILAIIVFIRSFLSITFDMEVDGHWPWSGHKKTID